MRPLSLALLSAATLAGACLPVEGERILAGDLSRAISEFTSVPPQTPLAYAPPPGVQHTLRGPELQRLALRFGVSLAARPADVCFALPMRTLERDELIAAMRASAGFGDAAIEIVDWIRVAVPAGTIRFPRQGLGAASGSGAGALWNGFIDYGANRHYAIWARVRIAVPLQRVVAIDDLREGHPIEAAQVRLEDSTGFPAQTAAAFQLDQVVGRLPRRSIARGSAIPLNLLSEPNDINRGDMVSIEVRSGAARLALTGRAETAGRAGQRISIRNLQSGKTFSALVAAKGKAIVTASGDRP